MQKTEIGIPIERIEGSIFLIRGLKVMPDRHLAELYGVETRVLNQAVRRNIERFPKDFMFPLTREEIRNLSQIVISPGMKHAPNVFAFTEQGVAMLSSVLSSRRAIEVNILIMRAFVRLREMVATHKDLLRKIEEMEAKYDKQFQAVFHAIKRLMSSPARRPPQSDFAYAKGVLLIGAQTEQNPKKPKGKAWSENQINQRNEKNQINQINQTNQTNQRNQTNQINQRGTRIAGSIFSRPPGCQNDIRKPDPPDWAPEESGFLFAGYEVLPRIPPAKNQHCQGDPKR